MSDIPSNLRDYLHGIALRPNVILTPAGVDGPDDEPCLRTLGPVQGQSFPGNIGGLPQKINPETGDFVAILDHDDGLLKKVDLGDFGGGSVDGGARANWTGTRFYAVDNVDGNDENLGYSNIDMLTAGSVAVKTPERLAQIIPPIGDPSSLLVIAFKGRTGIYTGPDGVSIANFAKTLIGYPGPIIRSTSDFSDNSTDRSLLASETVLGPYTVDTGGTTSAIPVVGGGLPTDRSGQGYRIKFTSGALSGTFSYWFSNTSGTITTSLMTSAPVSGVTFVVEKPAVKLGTIDLRLVSTDTTNLGNYRRASVLGFEAQTSFKINGTADVTVGFCNATGIVNFYGSRSLALTSTYINLDSNSSVTVGSGLRVFSTSTFDLVCQEWAAFGRSSIISSDIISFISQRSIGGVGTNSYIGKTVFGTIHLKVNGSNASAFGGNGNGALNNSIGRRTSTTSNRFTIGGPTVLKCEGSLGFYGAALEDSAYIEWSGAHLGIAIDDFVGTTSANYCINLEAVHGSNIILGTIAVNTCTAAGGPAIAVPGANPLNWDTFTKTNVKDPQGNHYIGTAGSIADSFTVIENSSAGAYAIGDIVRSTGVSNQTTSAQADIAANAKPIGVVCSAFAPGARGFMTNGPYAICNFDAVPTVGVMSYLSPTTAKCLTTTVPVTTGTIQSVQTGIVVAVISGTLAKVTWIASSSGLLGGTIRDKQIAYGDTNGKIIGSDELRFGTIVDARAIPQTINGVHLGYSQTLGVGSGTITGGSPDNVTPSIHHRHNNGGDTDSGTGFDFRDGSGIIDSYCHGSLMSTMTYQGLTPAVTAIIDNEWTRIKAHVTHATNIATPVWMNYSNSTVGIGFDALDNTSDMSLTHTGVAMLRVRAANLQVGVNGTTADPAYAFANFPTTGINADGSRLSFVQGGTSVLQLLSAFGIYAQAGLPFIASGAGSAAAPAFQMYSFGGGGYTCGIAFPSEGANLNGLSFNTMGADRGRFTNDGDFVINTGGSIGVTTGGSATDVAYRVANTPGTGVYGSSTTVSVATAGTYRATFYTNAVEFSYPIFLANGLENAPTLAFGGDASQDSGLWLFGANAVAMSTAGLQRTLWDADGNFVLGKAVLANGANNGFLFVNTTAGTPTGTPPVYAGRAALDFDSTNNILYFRNAANTLWIPVGGAGFTTGTGVANRVAYWSSATNLTNSANLTFDGSVLGIADGLATAPSLMFISSPTTGIWRNGANAIGFATNGVNRMTIYTNAVESSLPFYAPNGNGANPSYTFSGSTGTGLYLVTTNYLGISTGGSIRYYITSTESGSTIPFQAEGGVRLSDGSAAAPSLTFLTGATTTGLYRYGTNAMGLASGGLNRASVDASGFTIRSGQTAAGSGSGLFIGYNDDIASTSVISSITQGTSYRDLKIDSSFIDFRTGSGAVTSRFRIYTNALEASLPHWAANGSNSAPSYSFSNSTGTGMYLVSGNYLGLAAGGSIQLYATTTVSGASLLFQAEGGIQLPDGSTSTCAWHNVGDANTGGYFPADNVFALVNGGSPTLTTSANNNVMVGTTSDSLARMTVEHLSNNYSVLTLTGIQTDATASIAADKDGRMLFKNGTNTAAYFQWGQNYSAPSGEYPGQKDHIFALHFGVSNSPSCLDVYGGMRIGDGTYWDVTAVAAGLAVFGNISCSGTVSSNDLELGSPSAEANGTVVTVLGSLGPAGANTTVQNWLKIALDGNTRYIPCF